MQLLNSEEISVVSGGLTPEQVQARVDAWDVRMEGHTGPVRPKSGEGVKGTDVTFWL